MRSLPACLLAAVAAAAPAGAQEPADLILYNGKVFTADSVTSVREAVVVRAGRIVAVGGNELTGKYEAARVVDLAGRLLIPGFNDTHTHVRGRARRHVDMSGVVSLAEFRARLREKAEELGPGEWITGYGWSEDELAERRRPLRHDLDGAVPDNPAVITRAGGHSAVASSLAMELAGVTAETPDPEGGVVERDGDGEPTGLFRENWRMISRLVPAPSGDELRLSLIENLRGLLALGITSLTEAMTRPADLALWRDVYRERRGELPRATVQVHVPVGFGEGERAADGLGSLGVEPGSGDDFLRVGPLKLFVDGGYTGAGAWTLEPYRDQPDYFGEPRLTAGDLRRVLSRAHELGWQVGLHAIGDAAIEMAVDQLVAVLEASPRRDHRHYLNHFTVMPPERTLRLMADHDILIAQQPNFTYTLEGRYAENLTGDRLETNNPLRTPMSHGIFMALGGDILPTDPLVGIHAAVTRRGMSGRTYGEGERLTMAEALVAYTRNGAYLTFEETWKGTIEVGKVADLVVLSHDLLEIPAGRIPAVRVDLTVLEGRVVYEASP